MYLILITKSLLLQSNRFLVIFWSFENVSIITYRYQSKQPVSISWERKSMETSLVLLFTLDCKRKLTTTSTLSNFFWDQRGKNTQGSCLFMLDFDELSLTSRMSYLVKVHSKSLVSDGGERSLANSGAKLPTQSIGRNLTIKVLKNVSYSYRLIMASEGWLFIWRPVQKMYVREMGRGLELDG